MAEMMIGGGAEDIARRGAPLGTATRFAVDNLRLAADRPFGINLRASASKSRAGEIFGIAGVAGNGQNELIGRCRAR